MPNDVRIDLKELYSVLLEAYVDYGDLERLVSFGCGNSLTDIVPSTRGQKDVVFALVQYANAKGWLGKLVDAAIADLPHNTRLAEIGRPKPVFLAPHARNPFFTGRDEILAALRIALLSSGRTGLTQAITGMGGVGKTQTALEYCYRHYFDSHDYDAVLWAQAESQAMLLASFERIATALGLNLAPAATSNDVRDAVKMWLAEPSRGERYLLVLDNADDPATARDFVPRSPAGHLLITSRAQNLGGLGVPKAAMLPTMPPDKAVTFLLGRAARENADNDERTAAMELARELGYLPLALEQAAAYVDDKQSRYDTYLASFRRRRLELLASQQPVWGDDEKSIATTWSLSIEAVRSQSCGAADLLTASAFLGAERIPEEIFTRGGASLGPELSVSLQDAQNDPELLNELLCHLTRYSLIVRDRDKRSFDMHRLIQEAVRNGLPPSIRREWVERIASALASAHPGSKFSDWPPCERLLQHWLTCATGIAAERIDTADAANMLVQAGYYLKERARYAESEPLYTGALAILEKTRGSEDPETATCLNNLAALFEAQGRYAEAEPLFVRALSIREKALGPCNPMTASSQNNLATLYCGQGRYMEAEGLYVQAMTIREEALGLDHPDTATSMNDLAFLYNVQGRYAEAEPLYVRALTIWEHSLGPEHPWTAAGLNNLAKLHNAQARYSEAEPLYARALAIREKALGPDHPLTARSLQNLASLYCDMGRHTEAEPLYGRALRIYDEALGPTHPRTISLLENYANLLDATGHGSDASALRQRVADGRAPTSP